MGYATQGPVNEAVLVESWSDFQQQFGGLSNNNGIPNYLGYAVNQFFGNGGSLVVSFDPNAATGQYVYVSMWANKQVLQVDVSTPSAPAIAHTYATDMDPEGVAFLDARWMVVADDLGDTMSVIDRTTGTVTSLPVDASQPLHGTEPSTVAYDATSKLLYVTWSGQNAVAAYGVDTTQTPPAITPAGALPSGFWPSGDLPLADGSVVVSEMRGHGTGPRPLYFTIGNSDIDRRMRGLAVRSFAQDGPDSGVGIFRQGVQYALHGFGIRSACLINSMVKPRP